MHHCRRQHRAALPRRRRTGSKSTAPQLVWPTTRLRSTGCDGPGATVRPGRRVGPSATSTPGTRRTPHRCGLPRRPLPAPPPHDRDDRHPARSRHTTGRPGSRSSSAVIRCVSCSHMIRHRTVGQLQPDRIAGAQRCSSLAHLGAAHVFQGGATAGIQPGIGAFAVGHRHQLHVDAGGPQHCHRRAQTQRLIVGMRGDDRQTRAFGEVQRREIGAPNWSTVRRASRRQRSGWPAGVRWSTQVVLSSQSCAMTGGCQQSQCRPGRARRGFAGRRRSGRQRHGRAVRRRTTDPGPAPDPSAAVFRRRPSPPPRGPAWPSLRQALSCRAGLYRPGRRPRPEWPAQR